MLLRVSIHTGQTLTFTQEEKPPFQDLWSIGLCAFVCCSHIPLTGITPMLLQKAGLIESCFYCLKTLWAYSGGQSFDYLKCYLSRDHREAGAENLGLSSILLVFLLRFELVTIQQIGAGTFHCVTAPYCTYPLITSLLLHPVQNWFWDLALCAEVSSGYSP